MNLLPEASAGSLLMATDSALLVCHRHPTTGEKTLAVNMEQLQVLALGGYGQGLQKKTCVRCACVVDKEAIFNIECWKKHWIPAGYLSYMLSALKLCQHSRHGCPYMRC